MKSNDEGVDQCNFTSSSPLNFIRYHPLSFSCIEILYFYGPPESTISLQFDHFILDSYLLTSLRQIQRDLDWLAAFSTLLHHSYEKITKNVSSLKETECIFTDPNNAADYSIDTLFRHSLIVKHVKDLDYDVKLIGTRMRISLRLFIIRAPTVYNELTCEAAHRA